MALFKCREAIILLDNVRFYDLEQMNDAGIDVSQAPFFRSLLIAAYRDRFHCLKQRSNVSIPRALGRAMFGIIDESGTLNYGEVSIQHTMLNQLESEIVLGDVTVTKNSSLYPSDIRVLKAVDIPHLHDCIVFSSHGPRTPTNEITGSDLDGDVYWVCWTTWPSFSSITWPTIFSVNCATRDIAAAIDYPKTGINSVNDERRRELKAPRYPDFMEKEIPSYTSPKVLGKMYRHACCAFDMQTELEYLDEKHSIELGRNLLIDGFEHYLVDEQSSPLQQTTTNSRCLRVPKQS